MKIILSIIAIIIVALVIGYFILYRRLRKEDPEFIVQLIKQKAGDKTVGVTIQYNGERVVTINENEPLPLASTSKIIIAITYAQLVVNGEIDPNTKIPLEDLERFNIPKTDGGAHNRWLETVHTDQGKVSLQEIAAGMIAYSSNANADFLMTYLGLDRINDTIKQLGMEHHEPIYPIVSSMYMAEHFKKEENIELAAAFTKIEDMSMEAYRQTALDIHEQWKETPLSEKERTDFLKTINMYMQRLWTERLPKSTTDEYTQLMEKINNKNYFSKEFHEYLDSIMEHMMIYPANQELYKYAGQKGGSTALVVTMAMYAKDKQDNQLELVFFSNKLTAIEQVKVSQNINEFQRKFVGDEAFREKVLRELANYSNTSD